ncbi:3962_t:CDS:2 [Funneliformis caledonium]|uniref:3962_t:CDS:1 n=1 Tax=Funneliformis caledonium TaxID=1117310 RepID=A0A9N9DV96_9GLOM|nr:3962_t:CDS:2 [Funneliformis caledonium]
MVSFMKITSTIKVVSPEDDLFVDPLITLQLSIPEINVNSLDFLSLYNKINTAKNNLQRTTHDLLRCYYNFGQAIKQLFDYFRKTCNEDISNTKVNDRIINQISMQDKFTETNLRKRKEQVKKFSDFSNIGSIEVIEQLKSLNVTTILNLSPDEVDFLIARLNE